MKDIELNWTEASRARLIAELLEAVREATDGGDLTRITVHGEPAAGIVPAFQMLSMADLAILISVASVMRRMGTVPEGIRSQLDDVMARFDLSGGVTP